MKKINLLLVLLVLTINSQLLAKIREVNYSKLQIINVYIKVGKPISINLPQNAIIYSYLVGNQEQINFSTVNKAGNKKANIAVLQAIQKNVNTSVIIWTEDFAEININVITADNNIENKQADTKIIIKDPNNNLTQNYQNALNNKNQIHIKTTKNIQDTETIDDFLEQIDIATEEQKSRMQNIDFRYTIFSDKDLHSQILVFNDDFWTYFKIADNNKEIDFHPSIYVVRDGFDQLVNTRTRNGYIIAETKARAFTIQYGQKVICVMKIPYDLIVNKKDIDDNSWF